MTVAWIREPVEHFHKGVHLIEGSFRFNGASNPTTVRGSAIDSVAHTSTGVWTITLKEEFRNWKGMWRTGGLELDASGLSVWHWGAADESAGTLIVRVQTEATGTLALADVASGSNDGNWFHFVLAVKYSTAVDGSGF